MCKNCKLCQRVVKTPSKGNNNKYDYYCQITSLYERAVGINIEETEEIVPPKFCPLLNNETNKNSFLSSYKKATSSDWKNKISRKIEWEDVKVGEIYYCPKVCYEARKLVKITTKSFDQCTFKILKKYDDKPDNFSTMYKDGLMAHVLVKPKELVPFPST